MNRYLNRGANLLLLLLGMLSLCRLVEESFHLILPAETYLWLSLLCFLLWIATAFRFGILIGMPLSVALLIYLYQEKSLDLASEMRDLIDHINNAYYGYYSGSNASVAADGFSGSHEVAILLIFFILTAFVAVSLHSGCFRVSLVLLATAPIFTVCIAINGSPGILPVVGLLLFWTGLQLGGDSFRFDDGAGKALLFGLLPCLLVFSALLLLYNPDNYIPTEYDISLSQRFDKLGSALAEMLSDGEEPPQSTAAGIPRQTASPEYRAPNGWDRGSDDLDLTAVFDTSKLYEEAFQVASDSVGSLYLRGRSYGEYNGTAWSAAVENTHGTALSYVGHAIAGHEDTVLYSFQLQSPVVYDVLYLPYYSISDNLNDVKIPSNGYGNYSGTFYLTSVGADRLQNLVQLPSQLQSDELQYREFAHSYYTRLPDSTRTAMEQICREQGFSADQNQVIWSVADYVRRQGVYDVNVAPYPSSDYAVWFLTQSHQGYCIHFATAAVAIYRTLGIPARVCEGYLVNNTVPGRSVRVNGSDAHAWAEVYLDGIGWIPVEVTASA
ncbi:MAG: transglutaminase domain-containing protein, partial [Oscillospiraceae bacterium]|nr:transglutaminase domain-containing protein [Oscillospiraceae bacterium]